MEYIAHRFSGGALRVNFLKIGGGGGELGNEILIFCCCCVEYLLISASYVAF